MTTSLTASIIDWEKKKESVKDPQEFIAKDGEAESEDKFEVSATYFAINFPKLPEYPDEEYWKKFPSLYR